MTTEKLNQKNRQFQRFLKTGSLPQETNGFSVSGLPFWKKPEAREPEFENEWQRVQRLRQENHPLLKGGNWRETADSKTFNERKRRN